MDIKSGDFIWDRNKELANIRKHKVDFYTAAEVFKDPKRKIFIDSKHNKDEERLFCIGKVAGKILTVRFAYRGDIIRIFGAGHCRKRIKYYEEKN